MPHTDQVGVIDNPTDDQSNKQQVDDDELGHGFSHISRRVVTYAAKKIIHNTKNINTQNIKDPALYESCHIPKHNPTKPDCKINSNSQYIVIHHLL